MAPPLGQRASRAKRGGRAQAVEPDVSETVLVSRRCLQALEPVARRRRVELVRAAASAVHDAILVPFIIGSTFAAVCPGATVSASTPDGSSPGLATSCRDPPAATTPDQASCCQMDTV